MNKPLAYAFPDFLKLAAVGRTKAYEDIAAGRLRVRKNGSRNVVLADDADAYLNGLPAVAPRAA